MSRVRAHLIDAQHPEAVSLFRAARRVWPDDAFGSDEMSLGEELEAVKAILFNPAASNATHTCVYTLYGIISKE